MGMYADRDFKRQDKDIARIWGEEKNATVDWIDISTSLLAINYEPEVLNQMLNYHVVCPLQSQLE